MDSLENIELFLAVKESDYHACVDVFEHDFELDDLEGEIRFHHLKFDGNGRPMVELLAETLYNYIIDYCIASRNRPENLTTQQAARLTKQARALFRRPTVADDDPDRTGEAGEALLFFLMEAILKAPQIVAKMELKTNHSDEVKGSDGIHARWNDVDQVVDFFFGESKLYQSGSSAVAAALKSIDTFHEKKMYKHEFAMVTKFFKYADDEIQQEISKYIVNGEPSASVRINHVCLIGYDWKKYSLGRKTLDTEFQEALKEESARMVGLLNKNFESFEKKYLRFEVFFMPLPSVQDFRNIFNEVLG